MTPVAASPNHFPGQCNLQMRSCMMRLFRRENQSASSSSWSRRSSAAQRWCSRFIRSCGAFHKSRFRLCAARLSELGVVPSQKTSPDRPGLLLNSHRTCPQGSSTSSELFRGNRQLILPLKPEEVIIAKPPTATDSLFV